MDTDEQRGQQKTEGRDGEKVSAAVVAYVYFGGLLLSMVITWVIDGCYPDVLSVAWLFPTGCMVPPGYLFKCSDPFLYLGYLVYGVIFVCAFIFRKRTTFLKLLIVYILILVSNIGGCLSCMNMDIH